MLHGARHVAAPQHDQVDVLELLEVQPDLAHRLAGVPGWVGAADVVIAVSASGLSFQVMTAFFGVIAPEYP